MGRNFTENFSINALIFMPFRSLNKITEIT